MRFHRKLVTLCDQIDTITAERAGILRERCVFKSTSDSAKEPRTGWYPLIVSQRFDIFDILILLLSSVFFAK